MLEKLKFLEESSKILGEEIIEEANALLEGSDVEHSAKVIIKMMESFLDTIQNFDKYETEEVVEEEEEEKPHFKFDVGSQVRIMDIGKIEKEYMGASFSPYPEAYHGLEYPETVKYEEVKVLYRSWCDKSGEKRELFYIVECKSKKFVIREEGVKALDDWFSYKVGDRVKIEDTGKSFVTYEDFAKKHGYPETTGSEWEDEDLDAIEGKEAKVLARGRHQDATYGPLYIVDIDGKKLIIADDGLSKVHQFEIGEIAIMKTFDDFGYAPSEPLFKAIDRLPDSDHSKYGDAENELAKGMEVVICAKGESPYHSDNMYVVKSNGTYYFVRDCDIERE